MSLGHSALAPSGHPIWLDMARRSAQAVMQMEARGVSMKHILTDASLHNAMVTHAAFGGSTNLILHLPAIAHAAGLKRPTAADWARHKKYDQYLAATEEMLELTESEFAPWTIVEATSKWYARKRIFETIVAALEKRLGANAPPLEAEVPAVAAKDAELREAMDSLAEGRR